MDVGEWLKSLGLEHYETEFRENAITAALLPNLTADDLKDLGITLTGCGKVPDEPQYLAVTANLRTLPVMLKLPFSAAC